MNLIYKADICFTEVRSVLDYHRSIGTKIWEDDNGLWMDNDTWNRTKGEFAKELDLDIHFDDTKRYFEYFPSTCKCIHVGGEVAVVLTTLGDTL